ncbi:MAG TPA: hypothetical protein VG101_17710 [Puia sp.]|jgi:hypothetical protein|nr:hypothetical protein [Puia sp.]
MKRSYISHLLLVIILFFAATSVQAQGQSAFLSDSAYRTGAANTGRLWGYVFGDFYYKSHADSLNRGGSNQYSGIPQSRNAFQFRRLYLGYDFNISKKVSSELLLAAEDNFPAYNAPGQTAANGDELSNSKETFFIKLANVRVKDIWKGTDLIMGEQVVPSFANLTEKVWNYRSIERTIIDIRRTPSYDLGVGLNGYFDPATKNFGYDLLVATGNSDKPAASSFKWFYGDVFGWFANKRLIIDLYADYQRLNWVPTWHHDRQMLKGYIAWTSPWITAGVEGFINTIKNDTKATFITGGADTIDTKASGISMYLHGAIVMDKLRWFARVDLYNPNKNVNNSVYSAYAGVSSPSAYMTPGYKYGYAGSTTGAPTSETSTGDPTAKETFFTAGLDFMPARDVHFEPNVWYVHYASQLASTGAEGSSDIVWRMTFFFVFGKRYLKSYTQM